MAQFASYPSLRERVVFITGGGSGIGASIVEHFAAQGARVAFVDIAEDASRALVERLTGEGHSAPVFTPCDLKDIAALQAVIAETERTLGAVTVLVNNAANDTRHTVQEVTVDYWEDRMQVNVRHQFFAAQAVYAAMAAAGGGSIVNIGSSSWYVHQGGMPGYTTAKSAVLGLTRGLAQDFGPANIRVNHVVPGWIMTQRQIDLWLTEEGEARLMTNQCLKEKLYPPDVARMVLWLAADDSRLCTGQSFIVDGGWV